MKYFEILDTDFYQISMAFVYVYKGMNKEKTGFEGFVRHIKPAVTSKKYYTFSGENEIIEYMEKVRNEITDPELPEAIISLIEPKITNMKDKKNIINTFRKNWIETVKNDFEYNVMKEGTKVFPKVPVFQYFGDKAIGQLIETKGTNIYNGRTGIKSIEEEMQTSNNDKIKSSQYTYLNNIINNDTETMKKIEESLNTRAKEFRNSTTKILLEAAFRRSPTFEYSKIASRIALENGWDGTSNVSIFQDGTISSDKIGGTMAHAFIMSFPKERESFKVWDEVFPGTTNLIDTYDSINAAKMIKKMVENGEITKPKEERIDSDPMEELVVSINSINNGEIGNFVSGDMTPERLVSMEKDNIPFSKTMAGTKYVYFDKTVEKLNCGFVYKIVEYEKKISDFDDKVDEWHKINSKETINDFIGISIEKYEDIITNGKVRIYPEKKVVGKSNYRGLKSIKYIKETNTIEISYPSINSKRIEYGFNKENIFNTNKDTKIIFKEI